MSELQVFTFAPAWGLPTTGPFALKLLAWLDHAGLPYRQVIENRPDKGPLGKSPWIEQGGLRMGDSDAIILHLAGVNGLPDPLVLATVEQARADALKTAFEDRFHQILEWELFVHPAGAAEIRRMLAAAAPPIISSVIARRMCRHFARQLHARGIARLAPEEIAQLGRHQLDGLELCLADGGGWLGEGRPELPDFAVWGQVVPMLHWPMDGPVATHARKLPAIAEWNARIMAQCVGQRAAA